MLPVLNLLLQHGVQVEELTPAIHAVDRLLLQWQSSPASWQQLLEQAFGRSAPFELSAISLEILDSQAMAGIRGAYTASDPNGEERIYLNADWLQTATAPELEAVLLEEIGHAIDQRLNGDRDTQGDEGEIFSALLRGETPDPASYRDSDHYNLIINGQRIAVEAAAPTLSTAASPELTAIPEDSAAPSGAVGTLVSALIDSGGSLNNFSDSDGDSPAIAIIGTNLNGGTLYYSTDNGSNWSDVGTVSEASARVLTATATPVWRLSPRLITSARLVI